MSFVDELNRELAARRVRGAERRRILTEYADHIACEPESAARLGDPAALAQTFAAELAAGEARRVTRNSFAALVLTAIAVAVSQLSLGAAGGNPGYDQGASTVVGLIAVLLLLIASQVALVAGSLAGLRALRRRGAAQLPDAEVELVHRRCTTARIAGLATCVGLLLYVANFTQQLAGWWLAMEAALAAAAAVALLAISVRSRRRDRAVGGVPGLAGGLTADLPPLAVVAAHPVAACVVVTLAGLAAGTALGANAEHSLVEGLERGTFEALVIGVGLAVTVRLTRGSRDRAPG